jgi:hypothetical protein
MPTKKYELIFILNRASKSKIRISKLLLIFVLFPEGKGLGGRV